MKNSNRINIDVGNKDIINKYEPIQEKKIFNSHGNSYYKSSTYDNSIMIQHEQNKNQGKDEINPQQLNNYQFYNKLLIYTPLCYNGNGAPFWLINRGWWNSSLCVLIFNGIFVLVLTLFLLQADKGKKVLSRQNITTLLIINISTLLLIDISFIFTQFMNPGIINPKQISEEEYQNQGRLYCSRCKGNMTGLMKHCDDCQICVKTLDHHCGFFSKCIAGNQKYAFYTFIISIFGGFLVLLITLTSSIGL